MTNTGRKKRRKNAVVTMAFRLFFVLLLLSMLAAYISNQVTISSKRAELETLNEQVAQQQTENQELRTERRCRPDHRVGRTRLLQLRRTQ